MNTLRTLGWLCWLFGYLIGRIPVSIKVRRLTKKGRIEERDRILHHQVRRWTTRLLHHIKMPLTVVGEENLPPASEAVVFVCNHESYLDIPVLLTVIQPPRPLMARKEIGKIPLLGGWMRQLGCVLIERDDARAAMQALKDAEAVLQRGNSLIIFPEGTRARADRVGEFKAGAVRVATKAGVRIVPVALRGTGRALEGNHYRVRPSDVTVTIMPPIATAGMDRNAQKQLPQQLEALVRSVVQGPGENAAEKADAIVPAAE